MLLGDELVGRTALLGSPVRRRGLLRDEQADREEQGRREGSEDPGHVGLVAPVFVLERPAGKRDGAREGVVAPQHTGDDADDYGHDDTTDRELLYEGLEGHLDIVDPTGEPVVAAAELAEHAGVVVDDTGERFVVGLEAVEPFAELTELRAGTTEQIFEASVEALELGLVSRDLYGVEVVAADITLDRVETFGDALDLGLELGSPSMELLDTALVLLEFFRVVLDGADLLAETFELRLGLGDRIVELGVVLTHLLSEVLAGERRRSGRSGLLVVHVNLLILWGRADVR